MRTLGAYRALTNRSYATVSSIPSSAFGKPYGASAEPRDKLVPATLHLKTGQSFTGTSFGSTESKFGETVFSTSITSYTESMTDPSYSSQFIVFTTPMIGNYGVPHNSLTSDAANGGPLMSLESDKIECRGVIVSDVAEKYSHYLATQSLHDWCKRHNVPGITGVDTRAITNLLRNNGTTLGKISVGEGHNVAPEHEEYWDPAQENLIAQASVKTAYTLNEDPSNPNQVKIALLDFGAKANIMRSLVKRGASVTVLPWNTPLDSTLMNSFDGLFLSNGPGDPLHGREAANNVRELLDSDFWCNRPVFGICMGNQILGLAAGMETYRMPYGNRGHNQPVLALASSGVIKKGRVYVTSQNRKSTAACMCYQGTCYLTT
jgi:carbamoyl-phosphate synthase small subunit